MGGEAAGESSFCSTRSPPPMHSTSPPDLDENVVKALAAAATPLSSSLIHKALPVGGRPALKALKPVLERLAVEGRIVKAGPRTDKFIPAPAEQWAQRTVLAALARGPQTDAKLKSALTAAFDKLRPAALQSLIAAGTVFRHPPKTKAGKPSYALQPADPVPYLDKALQKLIAGTVALGFANDVVRAAIVRHLGGAAPVVATQGTPTVPHDAGGDAEHPVIAEMLRLDPRTAGGASIPLARLRHALRTALADGAAFDAAVLALARSGRVELQSHAWPARLSDAERAELIANGQGGWFETIALRIGAQTS
jgi:hypothetical protein